MKQFCEKCGIPAKKSCGDKDKEWVWSSVLNGYGETPHLCGKCHDKLFGMIKDCFNKFIKKDD